MIRLRSYIILIHAAAWLLFMAFPLLFLNDRGHNTRYFLLLREPQYWLFVLSYLSVFYINAELLIPLLLLKKRYSHYTIAFVLLLCIIFLVKPYDKLLVSSEKDFHRTSISQPKSLTDLRQPFEDHVPPLRPPDARAGDPFMDERHQPPKGRHFDSISVFLFLMMMGISTAIKLIHQWQLSDQRAVRAEADKSTAELSFLKAQINPHFLFNTLNNIYSLAVIKDEHTAESILTLSNIMRYVTDEVTADFVPLANELSCLRDYVVLQKLRLGDATTVNFAVEGFPGDKKIPPLLLMTFVENAFKHGVSKNTASDINIFIYIQVNSLTFVCKNSIFDDRHPSARTGLGLVNTRQRLTHLYPHKHTLDIDQQDGFFTVYLKLELDEA